MTCHGTAALLSFCATLLIGCGTPGAPQPPSLKLPKPVADLRAQRIADHVGLMWSVPKSTTDGGTVSGKTKATLCRSFSSPGKAVCRDGPDTVQEFSIGNAYGTMSDDISDLLADPRGHDFVNYTVEVFNDRGRSAGLSNVATVFLAPSVPRPQGFAAMVTSSSVDLRWQPMRAPVSRAMSAKYLLRTVRQGPDPAKPSVTLAELPLESSGHSDATFDWETKYAYSIVGVTQVLSTDGKVLYEFQGESSEPALVTTHDTFPPAVPANVQAVFSGGLDPKQNYIDITWTPDQERDLAGYIVYRSDGGAPVRLNAELLKVPALRDDKIAAGKAYTYSVSAVDERGNESARSQPASESVPQQP